MFPLRDPAAWSVFRALFSLSWRSTCAKDHGLFYLNYPQISEVGNPTTCAFICRSPSPRFHATIRHQSHAANPFSFLFPSSSPSWAYGFILIGTSSLLQFVLCSALTSLSLVYQARAGLVPSTDVLKVVEAFNSESNYTVWNDLTMNLSGFGTLLQNTDFYQNFQRFCVKLYEPVASKLGWEAKEGESESWLLLLCPNKLWKCKKLNFIQ